MCTGWIEVGGKHYYLYEDGHCAMNEITPDGFRVDADGAWYEAKRELLGQEFPLPAGFQNSISLGDGWGGRPQWSRREDKCGFRREKEAVD